MDLEIDGNAAIATASSSGLGEASTTALARQGVDVVIDGRDEERLAAAHEEFGGLDHLVTSAGGPPSGAFLGSSASGFIDGTAIPIDGGATGANL